MKPTPVQRFFASPWPFRLWAAASVIIAIVATIKETGMTFAMILSPAMLLRCLAGLLSMGALGFISGCFAVAPILILLVPWRSRVNGAPFKVGDQVQIITGRHQGTITSIYELWQGNTFRVELGPEAKPTFKDIFTPLQVRRSD